MPIGEMRKMRLSRRSTWITAVATALALVLALLCAPSFVPLLPSQEVVPERQRVMIDPPLRANLKSDYRADGRRTQKPELRLCGWFGDPAADDAHHLAPTSPGTISWGVPPLARPHGSGCERSECQACAPPKVVTGVDSATCVPCGEPTWSDRGPLPWDIFAHGDYVGPHRHPHVPQYRLRPDDELELVFRLTRERSGRPYELAVGDQIRIESIADSSLDRQLEVQPDGSITLPLTGQVLAAGRTTDEIRLDLEKRYKKYYKNPAITVTPIRVNTKLEDLRATVDIRQGIGGQSRIARVAPDGTISLPALGMVPAQGLTLDELKRELDARYNVRFDGIEVTPVLSRRAPRFIYVVGDVRQPGRYELVGPTTVIQSLALAQGVNVGANLRQIVIFRRAADWRLLATKVDVRGAMYGQRPAPADELWLRDSDIVIVPKSPVKMATDAISLIATNGVYAVAPFLTFPQNFTAPSTLN